MRSLYYPLHAQFYSMIYSCCNSSFLNSRSRSLLACSLVLRLCIIACVEFMCLCIVLHPRFTCSMSFSCHRIILMHASHTCIIVTEPSEKEPVEPAESIEPEPGVPFVVGPEVNQGKQLSMNHYSYLT